MQDSGEAARKALEFNNPLQILRVEGSGEQDHIALLTREAPEIIISSIRRHGKTCLLRAYEPVGRSVETRLEFAFPVKKAYRISEDPAARKELRHENKVLRDSFEPYELVMYLLEF